MNLFDGIARRLGYEKARQNAAGWMQSIGAAEKYSIPDGSIAANQASLYQKLSWINIAISTVAQSAAVVPFFVKRLEGEKRIDPHPEIQLSSGRCCW